MPRDPFPLDPERLKLLEQLFNDIAHEFEPEFDGMTMPEMIMSGVRKVIRSSDLEKLQRLRDMDGLKNLEMCLKHLSLAESYFRRSFE